MGAMQRIDDFAVDAARNQAVLFPQFLAFLWRAIRINDFASLASKIGERGERDVFRDFFIGASVGLDIHIPGDDAQFVRVANFVPLRFIFGDGEQRQREIASVIAVRGCAGGDVARHIACGNRRAGRAAHADWIRIRFGRYEPARTHIAHLATRADFTDGTRRRFLRAAEHRGITEFFSALYHFRRGGVNRFEFWYGWICHCFLLQWSVGGGQCSVN